jgi:PAS domain S-box-containing protein
MNSSRISNRQRLPLIKRLLSSGSSFPVRILTFAVIITLLVFTVFGLQFWNSYRELKTTQTFYLRLQELVGIIFHYDEILTMSARMGAATGNLKWEERYREYEPQLDATIKETIVLSPEIFMSKAAIETNTSNIQLVTMENRAFQLIRQGQSKAAMDLLFSEEYERHKVIYSKGMEKINSTIQKRIKGTLKTQRRRSLLIVTFSVITILTLLLAWFAVVRLIRMYVVERKKAEEALKESYSELEKKVDDRTADLQFSNKQLKREISQRSKTEKELRESEEQFQTLIETANDAIFIADGETGVIINANKQAGKLLGRSPEEIIGMHQTQLHPGEDEDNYRKNFLNHVHAGEGVILGDLFVQHKDGHKIPVEISASITKVGEKNIIQGIFRDITDRNKAEEIIRKSEEKYHNLVEHANDAILSINREGQIIDFNKKAEKLFGYDRGEILGEPVYILAAQKHRDKQKSVKKEFSETGTSSYLKNKITEGTGLGKDGKEFGLEISYYLLTVQEETIATAIIRDISERKEAERHLIAYQKQLKSLTAKIILTEEQDRQRFASFLHDEIGQQLFAVQLQLELLKGTLSSADSLKTLNYTIHNIKNVINHSRSLTSELSSPILHELGLEKALEWLTEQAHKKYDITVTFNDDKRKKQLDDAVKIFLYQAVRELLVNVAKHSRTKIASVSVKEDHANIHICVKDNGVGFDFSSAHTSNNKDEGFRLFHIKEQLDQLGGHLMVDSKPNLGTQVTLLLPLESHHEGL